MPKPSSNDLRDYNSVLLLFPSKYLAADDLRGRDVTVVIERIEPRHELQRTTGKDWKPVAFLRGKEKAWVLNKTNAKAIAKLYGKEVLGWIGKAVTIYPTVTQVKGEDCDCIRVRPRVPAAPRDESRTPAPRPFVPPEERLGDGSMPGDGEDFDAREAARAEEHFASREPGGEG